MPLLTIFQLYCFTGMEKVILLSKIPKTCNNINVRQTIFGTQKISREKKSNTVLINFGQDLICIVQLAKHSFLYQHI